MRMISGNLCGRPRNGELRRRSFLTGVGAVLIGAVTAAAQRAPSTTFYVSAAGSDVADGLTASTAWASIQKVNADLPSGCAVLFRRGDSFFGELNPPPNCEVGAFGSGAMPVLTMHKLLNRSDGWGEHSAGVWKIDVGTASTHDGYTATTDANVGHLVVDGSVMAGKKKELAGLQKRWDFWCDTSTNTLYVATDANPTSLAADIRAAPHGETGVVIKCDHGSANIHDVHVTGSGGHGITGVGPDVHIRNCLINYVGGSFLPGSGDGTVRYGNGIENWIGAKRWLIEKNEIAQVYDSAYTAQGIAGTGDEGWEDLVIRGNHIHDCTQSFEFWSTGAASSKGFNRILVEGNLCERAGYSDFADTRPNQQVRVQFLTYEWDLAADITVQYNTFDGAYSAYSYHAMDTVGLVMRNNTIRLRTDTKMEYQRTETVEQASTWQTATGRESQSTIVAVSE